MNRCTDLSECVKLVDTMNVFYWICTLWQFVSKSHCASNGCLWSTPTAWSKQWHSCLRPVYFSCSSPLVNVDLAVFEKLYIYLVSTCLSALKNISTTCLRAMGLRFEPAFLELTSIIIWCLFFLCLFVLWEHNIGLLCVCKIY